jgi:hypothetical protein
MKNSFKIMSILLLAIVVSLSLSSCSKQVGPKDEDAIKAIQSAIESNTQGNTLKSPVLILERGQQLTTGDWPIKVEYTIAGKDGSTKKMTTKYNLTPSISDMGANIWLVTEAK